jgi:hypothetical protein
MQQIVLALCLTLLVGCSTTEQLVMKSLYSITKTEIEDIKGAYVEERLLIFKSISMSSNEVATIDKLTTIDKGVIYLFTVEYLGPDWRYMERVQLKIDGAYFELVDSSPRRDVNTSSNVSVSEIVSVNIPNDVLEKLMKSKEVIFQYFLKPIKIPEEGLLEIKTFLY